MSFVAITTTPVDELMFCLVDDALFMSCDEALSVASHMTGVPWLVENEIDEVDEVFS